MYHIKYSLRICILERRNQNLMTMTESDFFDDWKSVRARLQELVNDLDRDDIDLIEVREGVLRLAKLVMMLTKGIEVLGEDYSYTVKMLKEREGQ
jgi:hypothetical protein